MSARTMTRVFAAILTSTALAIAARADIAAQSTAGAATISGRVLETGTDQPVRRAIVTLAGGALANGRSSVTDDDGRFSIARVPDGEFTLTATRPGFLKSAFGASRPDRPGTPISVRGGADRADVALFMTHGSALAGVIRDASGDPAPGMRVEAIRIRHLAAGDRAEKIAEARADDRGEYRIFGLPAGDYVLAATPAVIVGGMGDLGAPTEAEIDAKLNALRMRSALPSPGAPPAAAPPATPEKGYAQSAAYYPGAISPSEALVVTLGTNETREGLDIAARLSHAATVNGLITTSQSAVPQVMVNIQGGGPQLPIFGGSMNGPSIRTDNGTHTFQITNVPPGHYRLNARTMNVPGNTPQIMSSGGALPKVDTSGVVLWGSAEFDVSGDDLAGVTIALAPAPAVRGRIVADAAAQKPLTSFAGARVSLTPMPDSDRRSNGLSSPIVGVTTAAGDIDLPSVIPGTYRVSATLPSGWWLRSATLAAGDEDVLDGTLTVGADGISNLTLVILDRHSSVGGTLTTAGGPATEYFLVAFTADKNMWRAPSRRVRSARPATNGAFEISDLPPGQYFLAALKDLDALDLEDPAFLESLIPASATVTVAEGQKTIQDLLVGRSGTQ